MLTLTHFANWQTSNSYWESAAAASLPIKYFRDIVSLWILIHIDRDLIITGRLPHVVDVGKSTKSFAGDSM